jgi:hypothetical protein
MNSDYTLSSCDQLTSSTCHSLRHGCPTNSRAKPASAHASSSDHPSSSWCRTANPNTGEKGTVVCSVAPGGRSTRQRGDRSSHARNRRRLLLPPSLPPAPHPPHLPPAARPLSPHRHAAAALLLPPAPHPKRNSLAYLVVLLALRSSPSHRHRASAAGPGARRSQRTLRLSSTTCIPRCRCGRYGSVGRTCRCRRGALRRCGRAVDILVSGRLCLVSADSLVGRLVSLCGWSV